MRILFCPLASPGFVYPAIAVAHALQNRGHQVAFATDRTFEEVLDQAGIERVLRGPRDGASFQLDRWHHPLSVAMQVKHIEYATERFAPDVIVSHPLALGALIVRERLEVPVAVLGLATHLWPTSEALLTGPPVSGADNRLLRRYVEMMQYFNEARRLFGLPASTANYRETPLLGDVFMLQSVAELGVEIEAFPERAHLVGACLWEPPAGNDVRDWLAETITSAAPLIYVHHGRAFNYPDFWRRVVAALDNESFRVAAVVGRMDRETGPIPANFFVRDHLCQGAVLPHARLVITGGNTTPVLGALVHGLPSLILPGGGEQMDTATQVARAGAAVILSLAEATEEAIRDAVHVMLRSAELARRAETIAGAFSRIDGPRQAATLIEHLGRSRAPVTRRDVAGVLNGRASPYFGKAQDTVVRG
jgi:MGT family glycosyltransferase